MASFVSSLFSGGIKGAGEGIAAVVNAIKGRSPEDAAKIQELLTKHEEVLTQVAADVEKAKMQENVQLNQTAGENIRSEQTDKFSGRARPAVIWGGLLILFINFGVIALLPPWWNYKPLTFPDLFWEVWGICVTGYVFARTADKLFGGAGGSINGPLGIKLESKGDSK